MNLLTMPLNPSLNGLPPKLRAALARFGFDPSPAPRRARRRLDWADAPTPAAAVDAADDAADTPRGCGWFDSSWCLQTGLAVTEHQGPQDVVNDLPLAWWLAWQAGPELAAQRATFGAAADTAH